MIKIDFLVLALLAEILGTIGGFGSSVFFVPAANFYFDFHSVLGMTALFHVVSNLSKMALFKEGIDKRLLLQIGVPSVLFVIIGGLLSKTLDTYYLQIVLGFFLLVLSLVFLLFKRMVVTPNKQNAVIGGVLSGFSAGLLGTGGAIRGLTMAGFNLSKTKFIATSAFIDFAIDSTRTVVYISNGYVTKEVLTYIPALFFIGVFGTWIGKLILAKISQERFRNFSLLLILAVGAITLINALVK